MKITKNVLRELIKEQLALETELEQENKTAAGLALGGALFAGWVGLSVKERIDRIQHVLEVAKTEYKNADYRDLAKIYSEATGKTPEEDNMDFADLKIFAAGQKIPK